MYQKFFILWWFSGRKTGFFFQHYALNFFAISRQPLNWLNPNTSKKAFKLSTNHREYNGHKNAAQVLSYMLTFMLVISSSLIEALSSCAESFSCIEEQPAFADIRLGYAPLLLGLHIEARSARSFLNIWGCTSFRKVETYVVTIFFYVHNPKFFE